ncbi:MAG: glutathione S-transferase [Ramlibacter sp.]|nr:glutathione S-transferase [Ramlibacter sp.]
MLKLWGRISSINVRKVVLAAQWLEIPFQRVDAGHEFGVVQTSEYRAKNPNALVPLIEDGGFQLWESNVIVRYLAARHSLGRLYPQDLATRFDAERWMDWQQTTLNPAGRQAFIQLIRTAPDRRHAELVAQSQAAAEPLMALLDAHLSRQAFMAGDGLTMADLPIACEVHRWRALPLPRPARPSLDRWYQGIQSHPASRGALDIPLS